MVALGHLKKERFMTEKRWKCWPREVKLGTQTTNVVFFQSPPLINWRQEGRERRREEERGGEVAGRGRNLI